MHSFVLNPDLLVVNKDNVVVVVVVVIAVALLTLLTLSFVPPGHVAAPVERAEIPLAKAQRLRRLLLPVQSDGHHRRVCPEGGATGRGEDEEMSPQTGDSGVCVCVCMCVCIPPKTRPMFCLFCVCAAGEGGGAAGRNRHHAQTGLQELPAAFGPVRHAVWVAEGGS